LIKWSEFQQIIECSIIQTSKYDKRLIILGMIKLQKERLMGMNKGTSSNSTVSFLELSGAQKMFQFHFGKKNQVKEVGKTPRKT
jgi:hypothetical protein